MALRYGSKNGSALRYSQYSASALRYGSKIGWTSGGVNFSIDFSNPTPDSYFTFTELDDGTYSIAASDIWAMPNTIVLPSTYNGKAVTEIAEMGFYAYTETLDSAPNIEVIGIPASIARIGSGAFTFLINVKNVILEENSNLTSIDSQAFGFCGVRSISSSTVGTLHINLEVATKLTRIDDSAFQFAGVSSIIVPDSVTEICDYAFRNSYVSNVIIGDNVTSIGRYAFEQCSKLTNITLSDSVVTIGDRAFESCSNLTSIIIPDSVTSIGKGVFEYCDNLTSVVIGSGTTYIDEYAFNDCSNLRVVTFSENSSLSSIGVGAFRSCSRLGDIIIPDSVTSIGAYAFNYCSNLIIYCEVTEKPSGWDETWNDDNRPVVWGYTCHTEGHSYTSSVTEPTCNYQGYTTYTCSKCGRSYIDNYTNALGHIESDWIVDKEATPTNTGSKHKECTRCGQTIATETILIITTSEDYFTFTELDDGTYSIKAKSKNNLPDYVVIPSTYNGKAVTAIEMLAFNDTTIRKLYIHEGITSIGYASFSGCTNLVEVHLPASLTSIGEQAFNNCTSLAAVTIANNSQLVSIGSYVFAYCSALTSIGIPESVTTIGEYAFRNCSNLTIYCEVLQVYKPSGWATTWASGVDTVNWGYIILDDDYLGFSEQADGTYTIAAKDVTNMPATVVVPSIYNGKAVTSIGVRAFEGCDNLTSVVIPDSVTSIKSYAFSSCSSLASIVIGNSVTSISNYAFQSCSSLTSVVIPDSVTSINNSAFNGCSSLTSIEVNENNQYYTSIDGNLYSKDEKTLVQYAIGKKDTSFETPDSVTIIGSYAFYNCDSLTSVVIGDSVTSIGSAAFYDCSSLTEIVIPDSVTSIGNSAFYNCTSLVSIVIPDSVTSIGQYAFRDCSNLTIHCEASSKPSGWESTWAAAVGTVNWGYTGS